MHNETAPIDANFLAQAEEAALQTAQSTAQFLSEMAARTRKAVHGFENGDKSRCLLTEEQKMYYYMQNFNY